MSKKDYNAAHKRALSNRRKQLSENRSPYLASLDERLAHYTIVSEQDLGLMDIPIERIIGTRHTSRTFAFSSDYMPILNEDSEFATKWMTLYESQINEGIREPIIACEFENGYYVVEGNKRVSVMKYSGAISIPAYVTRFVPAYDEQSPEIKLYYQYIHFYSFTGMNSLYFSNPLGYQELCEILNLPYGKDWDFDQRRDVESLYARFCIPFYKKAPKNSEIHADDAFLLYLKTYGSDSLSSFSEKEVRTKIDTAWEAMEKLPVADQIQLVTDPEDGSRSIVSRIFPFTGTLRCAFFYYSNKASSGWTYSHEIGRRELEEKFGDEIETVYYEDIMDNETCMSYAEDAIEKKYDVLFFTSPRFLDTATKISVKYPKLHIYCCALNNYSGQARTYYGRLHEAKHLMGMLAGMLSTQNIIGYVADYPIAGAIADINAFALGLQATNANAKVRLLWNSKKDEDAFHVIQQEKIEFVSTREARAPMYKDRFYGLCRTHGEQVEYVASPLWSWGRFYERLIRSIQNGLWKSTAPGSSFASLTYWWGMSSGIIDIIYSRNIPKNSLRLLELVQDQIKKGEYAIFAGEVRDQTGMIHTAQGALSQEEIIKMDWLSDNVIGDIPTPEELKPDVLSMVRAIGISKEEVPIE